MPQLTSVRAWLADTGGRIDPKHSHFTGTKRHYEAYCDYMWARDLGDTVTIWQFCADMEEAGQRCAPDNTWWSASSLPQELWSAPTDIPDPPHG